MFRRKHVEPAGQPTQVLRCSFCNKLQKDVNKLIAGPSVFICDDCVATCNDIIEDDERVAKRAGRPASEPHAGPAPWPNAIECALCRTFMSPGQGARLPDNRGMLCTACVAAVQSLRPPSP